MAPKSDAMRASTLTVDTSTSVMELSLSAFDDGAGPLARGLPDYELLQQLLKQRQSMFHCVPGKGVWPSLQRILRPVRFQDPAMEALYQRWEFVSSHAVQKSYHLLSLALCAAIWVHQIGVGRGAFMFVAMALMIAGQITALRLVWRKSRSGHTFCAIIASDLVVYVAFVLFTGVCNEFAYSSQCYIMEKGDLAPAHFVGSFAAMLLFSFGLGLQVPTIIACNTVYLVLWIGLSVGLYPIPFYGTMLILLAMYGLLAVVATQAYLRQVGNRMKFHMVVELSHQVQDKLQAMKDLEVAHQDALHATEKAVRATTVRNIHASIMGYTCHQLRNPLHALRGILEHLRKRCTPGHCIDSNDVDNLQLMDDSAAQLAKVADDVLDFQKVRAQGLAHHLTQLTRSSTQLQNGTFTHKPSVADVQLVIDAAIRPVRDCSKVPIHVDAGDDAPSTLFADGARVTQMLHIGLSNAVKYHKPNTCIRIVCKHVPGDMSTVKFEVWNEGQGLGTLDVQTLFEPYERSVQEGQVIRGLGLGLPISMLLSRLLGGQVGLEDRGRHTIYWFTIPAAAMPSAALTPRLNSGSGRSGMFSRSNSLRPPSPGSGGRPATAASGTSVVVQIAPELTVDCPWSYWGRVPDDLSSPLNVMVVDDLRTNRRLLLAMLTRLGHHVTELEDGDEIANDLHEGRCIDVLMLDIHMVRSDGRDVARFLREQGHMFPIIAVTGNVSAADVASYQDAGFDGVLGKPFTSQHLASVLKTLVGSSQKTLLKAK